MELTNKIEKLRKIYLINISIPSFFASIPFKILGIGDFFKEVVMFNSKVIPKKLLDKGFVFKFESLKKIMTF
jgi:NAD dependent epimerase/dehydratase family enzyme